MATRGHLQAFTHSAPSEMPFPFPVPCPSPLPGLLLYNYVYLMVTPPPINCELLETKSCVSLISLVEPLAQCLAQRQVSILSEWMNK